MAEIDVRHSEAEAAYLDTLYAELRPEAELAYVTFFLARTPAHLQEDMKELVLAGLTSEESFMATKQNLAAPAPALTPYQQAREDAGPYTSGKADADAETQAEAKAAEEKKAKAERERRK